MMYDLDLDGNDKIDKEEFCQTYLYKIQELEKNKYRLQEDLKDLQTEKKFVIEDREWERTYGRSAKEYDRNLVDLRVTVVEARELEASDMLSGSSDPYMLLVLGFQIWKTTIKRTTLYPVWKETFTFNKLPNENILEVTWYDYDTITSDEIIGSKKINLNALKMNDVNDEWYTFDAFQGKTPHGKFRLILHLVQHIPPDYKKIKLDLEK